MPDDPKPGPDVLDGRALSDDQRRTILDAVGTLKVPPPGDMIRRLTSDHPLLTPGQVPTAETFAQLADVVMVRSRPRPTIEDQLRGQLKAHGARQKAERDALAALYRDHIEATKALNRTMERLIVALDAHSARTAENSKAIADAWSVDDEGEGWKDGADDAE